MIAKYYILGILLFLATGCNTNSPSASIQQQLANTATPSAPLEEWPTYRDSSYLGNKYPFSVRYPSATWRFVGGGQSDSSQPGVTTEFQNTEEPNELMIISVTEKRPDLPAYDINDKNLSKDIVLDGIIAHEEFHANGYCALLNEPGCADSPIIAVWAKGGNYYYTIEFKYPLNLRLNDTHKKILASFKFTK